MRHRSFTLALSPLVRVAGPVGIVSLVGWVILTTGEAYAQEKKVDGARAVVKASPNDVEAALALGKVLRRAGRSSEAIAALQPMTLRTGASDALRYELMRAQADTKNHEGAQLACRGVQSQALKHACLGEAFVTVRKLGTEGQPEIDKALKIDPTLYEARYVTGLIAALDGRVKDAEGAFRQAMAKDATRIEARVGLAQLLETTHRASEAADELRSTLVIEPDNPEVLFEMGRVLPAVYEARDSLVKSLEGRPAYGAAWGRLAEVSLELEKNDEAASAAEKALKDEPKNPTWLAVLAESRVRQARWDDALTSANAALAASPTNGRARLALADAQAAKGDIDGAIDAYAAAFGSLRTDPSPLVRAARACLAKGRDTTAKSFADKVTGLFPQWAPGWDVAGDVAKKAGDASAARSAWTKALTGEGDVEKAAIQAKIDKLSP